MARNRVVTDEDLKRFKWVEMKDNPPPNSVIYILNDDKETVDIYVTDENGVPKPIEVSEVDVTKLISNSTDSNLKVEEGKLYSKKYVSGDVYIDVVEGDEVNQIKLNASRVEVKSNRQNSLKHDGTGKKYPTVDAVNTKVREVDGRIKTLEDRECERGYSAYEVAKQNGFKGTEKEWLESLKGSSFILDFDVNDSFELIMYYSEDATTNFKIDNDGNLILIV